MLSISCTKAVFVNPTENRTGYERAGRANRLLTLTGVITNNAEEAAGQRGSWCNGDFSAI